MLGTINKYMKCNLLHINMSKCCYMHFEPRNDQNKTCARTTPFVSKSHVSKTLYLNNIPIQKVKQTKFLGIILDEKLDWCAHIEYLTKKLRSATGVLCRIRHSIPKQYYRNLYFSLFKSHLT